MVFILTNALFAARLTKHLFYERIDMVNIFENLLSVADRFDTILVDAYGVFWNGADFYAGSCEVLQQLVKDGKKIIILSNTPHLSSKLKEQYRKRGLYEGVHYADFVSSGDALHNALVKQDIDVNGNKIWIFGTKHRGLFAGTKYEIVDSMEDADAFYISTPRLLAEQAEENSLYENCLYLAPNGEYDSTTIEPFIPTLKKLYHLGLPAINANPDLAANEVDAYGQINFVLRPGSVAETYRRMGGKVIEFGKPHKNIFDYTFKKFNIVPNNNIAMVGDTYRTDIKGAQNSGICGVWCVETGVTAEETSKGSTLEQLCGGNFSNVLLIKRLA